MTRKSNSGVTQLELLISLTVIAMISLLLASVFNFSRQSLERTELSSKGIDVFLVRRMLRSEVEMIELRTHSRETSVAFIGEPQWFRVSSPQYNAIDKGYSSISVTMEMSSPNAGNSVFVNCKNFCAGAASGDQSHLLASDVMAFKIKYYGRDATKDRLDWHDSWAAENGIPTLIKLEWDSTDGRASPPIVLQPGKFELQSSMSLSSLSPPG